MVMFVASKRSSAILRLKRNICYRAINECIDIKVEAGAVLSKLKNTTRQTIRPALDAYALALTPDGLALVAPRVLVLSFRYLCFTTPAVQLVLQCQPAVRKFHRNCARHMF